MPCQMGCRSGPSSSGAREEASPFRRRRRPRCSHGPSRLSPFAQSFTPSKFRQVHVSPILLECPFFLLGSLLTGEVLSEGIGRQPRHDCRAVPVPSRVVPAHRSRPVALGPARRIGSRAPVGSYLRGWSKPPLAGLLPFGLPLVLRPRPLVHLRPARQRLPTARAGMSDADQVCTAQATSRLCLPNLSRGERLTFRSALFTLSMFFPRDCPVSR